MEYIRIHLPGAVIKLGTDANQLMVSLYEGGAIIARPTIVKLAHAQ